MRQRIAALALVAALAAGCATTQEVAVNQSQSYCPFLGAKLCAQLVQANDPSRFTSGAPSSSTPYLRYINPNVQWSKYTSVMLLPVTYWDDNDDPISVKDQHTLTNFFYESLEKHLATKYTMVTEPGPGVMRVHVALDDATSATPVLRTISMVIPQARALATLKFLATGSYPFVGSAQAELKITDGETGAVLVAAVDKRIGGGALGTAAQWQWGDAENALNAWSQQLVDRLNAWTSGAATPP